jgi:transcriptional regulator with XRE-family HTH domain
LGERLRQLRRTVSLSQAEVADLTGGDHTVLSRRERAEVPFTLAQVTDLLNLYAVHTPRVRDEITRLARDMWHTSHLDNGIPDAGLHCHEHPADMDWLTPRWLEEQTRLLRVYETGLVPRLLRTPGYAEACLSTGNRQPKPIQATTELVHRIAAARTRRLRITAVVEEAALRRRVGGPTVLRDQLKHLLRLSDEPWIDLRIIPAELPHPYPIGSFTIHNIEQLRSPVVMVRVLSGCLYLEGPAVDPYVIGFDRLCALSVKAPTALRRLLDAL